MVDSKKEKALKDLVEKFYTPENDSLLNRFELQKIFYHGTDAKFEEFENNKMKNGWLGKGFYFTDDKKIAKSFGKKVFAVFLDIKNPYISKSNSPDGLLSEIEKGFNVLNKEDLNDLSSILKDNGFDGIVYKHWDESFGTYYSVFDKKQIKIIDDNKNLNKQNCLNEDCISVQAEPLKIKNKTRRF